MKQSRKRYLVLTAIFGAAIPAFAGGNPEGSAVYAPRFDVYLGYAYFNTPKLSLAEHGAHLQVGLNVKRWLALGLDYSRATGDFGLSPTVLKPEFRDSALNIVQQFKDQGIVPPGYTGAVPTNATTQTLAGGPQLVWRHRRWTLIYGPSIGWVLEKTKLKPYDMATNIFVSEASPDPTPGDHKMFFGGGAAVDINATRHFGLRVRVDVVHDNLFTDSFLAEGRWTTRVSIGPSFHFGKSLR